MTALLQGSENAGIRISLVEPLFRLIDVSLNYAICRTYMMKNTPVIPFLYPLVREVEMHGAKALPQIFQHIGYDIDPSNVNHHNRSPTGRIWWPLKRSPWFFLSLEKRNK